MGYAFGWSIINRLRDQEQKRLGGKFSLCEFHDKLLSAGSISLPLVERRHLSDDRNTERGTIVTAGTLPLFQFVQNVQIVQAVQNVMKTKETPRGPFLGAHMSIAGGVGNAFLEGQKVDCEAIQIFTKSSRQWASKP